MGRGCVKTLRRVDFATRPEVPIARYVEGSDRQQVTLLPECLDDYIAEDNPVRVVDAFRSAAKVRGHEGSYLPLNIGFRFCVNASIPSA